MCDKHVHNNAPIGVMDSGVGGLSVLHEIRRLLPAEKLLYMADSANLPYGDKTPAFVRERVNHIAEELVARGAKALVVACNTATAAAVESLRERLAIPVIGMEPGVKPAVLDSKSGIVGILATEAMVRSNRMRDLVGRFAREVEVVIQPCPGLVEQVERQALHTPETARLLQGYLKPILERGADTLVLGCTHYPFLQPLIEQLTGPSIKVINTGGAVARQLKNRLLECGLLADEGQSGSARFFTSGDAHAQQPLFRALWGETVCVEPLPTAEGIAESPQTILDFWFSERVKPLWFHSTPEFDCELRQRFESTWQAARSGRLHDWEASTEGALALVIILDQFPLNMYRNEAAAYSTEAQARAIAARLIDQGLDQGLDTQAKGFLYLPFMHSESLADQERSVGLYQAAGMSENLRYARHHSEIVRRFGRFPHRNAALGRESSAEELEWLQSKEGYHG